MSAARILILIPHPDDEIVACGIAARRAAAAGAQLFGLYLTTGVPDRATLLPWHRSGHAARVQRRRDEAVSVAARVPLTPVGFADFPARSLKTHLAASHRTIAAALTAHAIDALWTPAWEGAHQDHDATNFLAAQFSSRVPVTEFAAYSFVDGRVHSQDFGAGVAAEIVTLTAEEQAWKRTQLATYASERGNLAHIRWTQEARRPLPPHDYARSPHPGKLFYQRFQWVPFRHPRIDFEQPQAVCAALAAARREIAGA